MEEQKKLEEQEYIGNIWGWKFSLWGLVFILLLVGVLIYRQEVLGIPINQEMITTPTTTETQD